MSQEAWWKVAIAGCVMVVIVFIIVAGVIADKESFGELVTPVFLPIITGSLMIGALLVLVASWKLRSKTSRWWLVLFIWALIAVTSPAFGIMFLAPWFVLAVSLPAVAVALSKVRDGLRAGASA